MRETQNFQYSFLLLDKTDTNIGPSATEAQADMTSEGNSILKHEDMTKTTAHLCSLSHKDVRWGAAKPLNRPNIEMKSWYLVF